MVHYGSRGRWGPCAAETVTGQVSLGQALYELLCCFGGVRRSPTGNEDAGEGAEG